MPETVVLLKKLVDFLVLPPGGPLLLILLGLLLIRRRPRTGARLAWFGIGLALLLSTRVCGYALSTLLETEDIVALDRRQVQAMMSGPQPPQAIVVLSGGARFHERDRPDPNRNSGETLTRLMHGVRISRWTGLPILVTGGAVYRGHVPEARTMASAIETVIGYPVKWVEDAALDTADNASYSARILRPAGIDRILLVTSAWHMKRSQMLFRETGLIVTPAPIGFTGSLGANWMTAMLPSTDGMSETARALHELMGLAWHRLKSLRRG